MTNGQAKLIAAAILVAGGIVGITIGSLAYATDKVQGFGADQVGIAATMLGLVLGIYSLAQMAKENRNKHNNKNE